MKILKLLLKVVAGLFGLIILAAILIPVFFKDHIRAAIDAELEKSLTATVFYDVDDFSVSLLRSFPNLSVRMSEFGIKGEGVFESDTLAAVKNFELTVDLSSLFGDVSVNKIQIDEPRIMVMVLEDGTANYDIAVPSEEIANEEVPDEGEASDMAIKIDRWEINNAEVVYYDQSMAFYTTISGFFHSGSGNLRSDVFEMVTKTTAEAISLGFEGTEYLSNKSLDADIIMNMDMANMKFDFAENRVTVNDFGFGFDGFIAMLGDDIEMDITFAGNEIDLKSVLSLIPGAYEEYLEGITASGDIAFDGFVRGVYNDDSMPRVKSTLNIANGKIIAADAPAPVEKLRTEFTFDYPSADLAETNMQVDFGAEMAGQQMGVKLDFRNLVDYQWDLKADVNADMAKLSKVLPMPETVLKGVLDVDLATAGRMSDVDAENWGALPTTGSFKAKDFFYSSPDLPQGFGMSAVDASFDPSEINLSKFEGNAGRTDLNLTGKLTNYLAFALGDEESFVGNLAFNSKLIDVDEWMTGEVQEVSEDTTASAPLEVVRIPTNVDFTFASSIDEIKYTDLTLSNFAGKILVKDGSVILEKSGFEMLNGLFEMTGEYASAQETPSFDFDFGIKGLSIPKAFDAFTPIQKMVPVAKNATGNFSTNFKANGLLGSDMMPIMNSISGSGLVEIAEAAITDVKVLDGIRKVANLKGDGSGSMAELKDVLLNMEIKDGRISVKPFNMKIAGNDAVISGSSTLDGGLDYAMAMKVPSGQAGQAVNNLLSNVTGGKQLVSEYLDLNLGIGGTYNDPKIKLIGAKPGGKGEGSLTASVKDQVKDQANEKIAEAKKEVTEKVNQAADSVKAEANALVEEKKEEAKQELEKKAKDAVKGLFKKKKKNN